MAFGLKADVERCRCQATMRLSVSGMRQQQCMYMLINRLIIIPSPQHTRNVAHTDQVKQGPDKASHHHIASLREAPVLPKETIPRSKRVFTSL